MKKKILIINKSFELGGIQVALANLLDNIHNKYEVSLAIFNPIGPLRDRVPNNVKIIKLSPLVNVLGMNAHVCKKHGTLGQKIFKFIGGVWTKIFGNFIPMKVAMLLQKNVGEYDIVISYHQETSFKTLVTGFGEFALNKCKAKKKIAWVHADFLATKLATKRNYSKYKKFDQIVCVSKDCMNNFIRAFPDLSKKCDYCYNYVDEKRILELSQRETNVFETNNDTIILFSACRLVKEKGIIQAISNLCNLWEKGYNIKWYIAGEGVERKKIENIIFTKELEDKVILLGYKENPYPYLRESTFLFLPSLHETFSMVVSEAHILGIPIIAANIPIMREVLGEFDYLCDNFDYANCIKNIIDNKKNHIKVRYNNFYNKQFERIIEKC